MSDGDVTFAGAFPPATAEQWRAVVDKALKGAPFEKRLMTRLYEGIAVQPLYTADDWQASGDPSGFPGFAPFTRGGHAAGAGTEGWAVATEHTLPDPKQANKAILADLLRGATAIDLHFDRAGAPGIVIDTLDDLDTALDEVLPELVPLSLDAGQHAVAAAATLAALWRRRSVPPADAQGAFDADPIGTLAASGSLPESLDHALARLAELATWAHENYPKVTSVGIDSSPYYEAGATETQDLAAAMSTGVAYLRALTAGGMAVDDAARPHGAPYHVPARPVGEYAAHDGRRVRRRRRRGGQRDDLAVRRRAGRFGRLRPPHRPQYADNAEGRSLCFARDGPGRRFLVCRNADRTIGPGRLG
jgi:methylmalonyl-CoA mutase